MSLIFGRHWLRASLFRVARSLLKIGLVFAAGGVCAAVLMRLPDAASGGANAGIIGTIAAKLDKFVPAAWTSKEASKAAASAAPPAASDAPPGAAAAAPDAAAGAAAPSPSGEQAAADDAEDKASDAAEPAAPEPARQRRRHVTHAKPHSPNDRRVAQGGWGWPFSGWFGSKPRQ